MIILSRLCIFCLALCLCQPAFAASGPSDAAQITRNAQRAMLDALSFADADDFADASRGFVAGPEESVIKSAGGRVIYNLAAYDFLKAEEAPPTVNPSLWRQARLNMHAGLFKVVDGIYQIRGLDISNMTIIEGESGIIIIDPLISKECAAAGLALYYRHVPGPDGGRRPVKAVIYTHSHTDHYGGVKGVISEADVASGAVAVIAPEGFMEAAVSENVLAGNAMSRRATYMYGNFLERGPRGQVDAGLGKATSSGTLTLVAPTDIIRTTGESRRVDGVDIEFQMAPETEAPAEMLLYFPQFRALCTAEDATHTMHNLYTLRGAQVRDANKWWRALDQALDLFAARTDVVFAQHHWPRWGQERVKTYLAKQRNAYKYLHDQTLRLANHGHTPREISEMLTLPPSLAREWHLRGYYGTVRHNIKAVYQRYLGWYDGNPANLDPLPPEQAGANYVAYMGGAQAVIAKARESYDRGEYRWVAEVLSHVVFADPDNVEARELQASAFEQLGYLAESGPWRNVYLTGARELRARSLDKRGAGTASPDVVAAMNAEMVLDFMAVKLNGEKAAGKTLRVGWKQPDTGEVYTLSVEDGVLLYTRNKQESGQDTGNATQALLSATRPLFAALVSGLTTLDKELAQGRVTAQGDVAAIQDLFSLLDSFELMFNIVTP